MNQVSYTTGKSAIAGLSIRCIKVLARNVSKVSFFDKIDTYVLSIKDNSVICEEHWYSLLWIRLAETQKAKYQSLRNVTVEGTPDSEPASSEGTIYTVEDADRAELMRFYGGDLRSEYFFAPKDDPYTWKRNGVVYRKKSSWNRELGSCPSVKVSIHS